MYRTRTKSSCVLQCACTVASFPGSPSAFPSGGSKVIRGIIARKEGEPGNEATCTVHVHDNVYYMLCIILVYMPFSGRSEYYSIIGYLLF